MADNLPLIPNKREAVCADVKPVLREVFREDQLPPLLLEKIKPTDEEQLWIDNYKSECEEIQKHEVDLKEEFAKRISKKPKRNLYRLFSPKQKIVAPWKLETGMMGRNDLMPAIEQNAGREKSLWVQNIFNSSSCRLSSASVAEHRPAPSLDPLCPDAWSLQTLSYGETRPRPRPPAALAPPAPARPARVVCVPPRIDFVNCTLGHVHTQELRFVNVCKLEVRLSVRPPRRRELSVELGGARGLVVTSGAAAEFKVHFRPLDVRTIREKLRVRVSTGEELVVHIACYMQPPVLHIFTPSVPSVLSDMPERDLRPSPEADVLDLGSRLEGDVLDLGSRLLGDAHSVPLLLQSAAAHATFFLVTDDAWVTNTLEELTTTGALATGPFIVRPAWWAGGGLTRGAACCLAPTVGLHSAALRILSSTAATRTLHVVADSLYFSPDHITIEAHQKDYDICSEDDPDCEYYVHLGTAFPNRSLSTTVQLINKSAVPYSFYWSARPWGECACWRDGLGSPTGEDGSLCPGAREAMAKGLQVNDAPAARAEPAAGGVGARAACAVRVSAPDVGARPGTRRAVLLLIVKDIPKDSFPDGLKPMVVDTRTVETQLAPGMEKSWSKQVCDVICAQMEVWWEVVPVRFVLDPPVLPLVHSRRVSWVQLSVRATQLLGSGGVPTRWRAPPWPAPPAPRLAPAHSVAVALRVPLPPPGERPAVDVLTLTSETDEWASSCRLQRACATRHPALAPARAWLGVVPPGARVTTAFVVTNDTFQDISWKATPFRWWGASAPSAACAPAAGAATCPACREAACSCALLAPARGALAHGASHAIRYDINAPARDTCVATLVQVRRAPGTSGTPGASGTAARASLAACRVLAPRLMLRVLPCAGDKHGACAHCELDLGAQPSARGATVLRPRAALALGRRACCRLRATNLTPVPTTVRWQPPPDDEDVLRVEFIPNDFDIGSFAEKTIQVVLEARRVSGRRLFVQRAHVTHAHTPLYLLIDAAIEGVKIMLEVPLGGEEKTDSCLELRATQREVVPWDNTKKPLTAQECFEAEDRIRYESKHKVCRCPHEMVYIPPPKEIEPPLEEGEYRTPELLLEPPPLTRVCPCCRQPRPQPGHAHPCCLQYQRVPLRTVRTRRLMLRNVGALPAVWRAELRRWPLARRDAAATEALIAGKDRWAGGVRAPGVALRCAPGGGSCAPGAAAALDVAVYADCWGCYRDQLLIRVEGVDPIVVDVWVEALGPPLQLAPAPAPAPAPAGDAVMWLSASDPARTLRARNSSRAALAVRAYTVLEHEHPQNEQPFRLYMRFIDMCPRTCPCNTDCPSDEASTDSSALPEEADTGIELFFSADHGPQDFEYYTVEPRACTVAAGASAAWRVALAAGRAAGRGAAPRGRLLLRTVPVDADARGPFWGRAEPAPALVALRTAPRQSALCVTVQEVRARLCALDLPYKDVARIRKRFRIQNTGSAPLTLRCATRAPWSAVRGEPRGGCAGCGCERARGERVRDLDLTLDPSSSTAMCVEVCVSAAEVWPSVAAEPCAPPAYELRRQVTGAMEFYEDQTLLQKLPLVLEVEFPRILVEPASLDFGFVADGDTRKTYFTVWHSSTTATISVHVTWHGGAQFRLFPRHARLPPGARARVCLQYTARWAGAPAPAAGCARAAAAGAGAWCAAAVRARAEPSRDRAFSAPPHDHTDDAHLFPPAV